jgi:hypothetical protein
MRSDIVLTHTSTSGIEVSLLGKPMICVNLNDEYDPIVRMYVDSGVAVEATTISELKGILSKPWNGLLEAQLQNRNNFISEQAYLIDGDSTRRVGDIAVKLMSSLKG